MKVLKRTTDDVKYVDCMLGIQQLEQCRINGVSSILQTVKSLPFLISQYNGFYWNPRINLETGEVFGWPKGLRAEIYFGVKFCECTYLDENGEISFGSKIDEIPSYLQLDLIDVANSVRLTINTNGFVENWPSEETIIESII